MELQNNRAGVGVPKSQAQTFHLTAGEPGLPLWGSTQVPPDPAVHGSLLLGRCWLISATPAGSPGAPADCKSLPLSACPQSRPYFKREGQESPHTGPSARQSRGWCSRREKGSLCPRAGGHHIPAQSPHSALW